MNHAEFAANFPALAENRWQTPDHYFGYAPESDYVVMIRYRDSTLIDVSNWEVMLSTLGAVWFEPSHANLFASWATTERPDVYVFSASVPGGFVDYMMIRPDAPYALLKAAEEALCALSEYPVLDDSDYSEREHKAICELWEYMPLADRIDLLRDGGEVSILAARHNHLPECSSTYNTLSAWVNE